VAASRVKSLNGLLSEEGFDYERFQRREDEKSRRAVSQSILTGCYLTALRLGYLLDHTQITQRYLSIDVGVIFLNPSFLHEHITTGLES